MLLLIVAISLSSVCVCIGTSTECALSWNAASAAWASASFFFTSGSCCCTNFRLLDACAELRPTFCARKALTTCSSTLTAWCGSALS